MATLQFRLSSRVTNGKAEVLVRFYEAAFQERAKSRVFCPVSAWNEAEGLPTIPRRATSDTADISDARIKLEQLRDYVYERWFDEKYDARAGWLQQTIDDCFSIKPANAPKTIRDVYEEYVATKGTDWNTQKQYHVLLAALDRFAKKRTLYIDKITVQDIDAFAAFYRCEPVGKEFVRRAQNTVTSKLKRWRALQRFAVMRGYAPSSPFDRYTIPAEVYGTPIYLTTEERDALYAYQGLSDALRIQRDIFVFQCHVGCRVSDLVSLTKSSVSNGFLQYIPQKQRRSVPLTVRVPLSQVALEIIERYADIDGEELLPFIHPNNYNEAIHEITRAVGLDRVVTVPNKLTMQPEYKPLYEVVTSHTARKTFIEAVFRETKSERITSSFTGHADGSRAFSRYTEVDDDMKREILERLQRTKY